MSNNIENRVVQLEMRNSSLEKGANQSIKTLDKLDKALDLKNGKRSFEDVEKAAAKCNFQPLLKAADTINQRFSTMGIMGARALERITDKAVDAGLALTKSLTIDQITAGYSKYEQKTASVQTIMNATGKSLEEINGYLDKLMWFSDETSYNFSDMLSALATFTAGGHDIDDMIPMIEGFAASVAFAGKGASEFSHALQYGLVDAFGKKVMMTSDWKTLENLNLNSKQLMETFIATGEALGTIEEGTVTVANFRDSLSKGWLNDKVMSQGLSAFASVIEEIYDGVQSGIYENYADGLEKIGDKFGEVARAAAESAQQTKTYTEAVDAAKDAASSQWLKIFESIFGDFNQQKELWGEFGEGLIEIFVTPLSAVADIINSAFQETPVTRLADVLNEAGVSFDQFKAKVIDVAKTLGVEIGDSADKVESFGELLSLDWIKPEIVTKVLDAISGAGDNLGSFVESEVNALELAKRLNKGEFGYGIKAMTENLKKAGYDVESAQEVYNLSALDANATIKTLSETVSEVSEETANAFKDAYELAAGLSDEYYTKNSGWKIGWDGVRNVLGGIIDRIDMVKKAWGNVFPAPTAAAIKDAIISFHKWSESLKMGEEEGNKITAVATRIFNVLKWGLDVVGDVVDITKTTIRLGKDLFKTILNTPVIQDFLGATSGAFEATLLDINHWIYGVKNWLDETGDHLMAMDWNSIVQGLSPVIRLVRSLRGLTRRLGSSALSSIVSIGKHLLPIGSYIYNNLIIPFADFLVELIESDDPIKTLKDGIVSLAKKAKDKIKSVIDALKGGKIGTMFGDFMDRISPIVKKFDELKTKLKDVIENAGEMVESIDFGKIISIVTLGVILIMLSKLSDAFKKIGDAAGSVKDTFKGINNVISSKFGSGFAMNAKAVAGAVVALAAALYVLASIPKEGLIRSSVALGIMMVILGLIAGAMAYATTKLSAVQVKKIETMSKPLLALSAAMLLLSYAARNASIAVGTENTWKRVFTILTLVGGLALELVGLTWLMTLVGGKISVGAIVMMVVAVAILKLAQALKVLENLKLSDDAKSVVGLVAVIAAIGLAISALGKATKGGLGAVANIGIGIFAAVGSIYIATLAIEKITNADMEYTWTKLRDSLVYIAGIAIGVIAAIVILAVVGKKLEAGAKAVALLSAGVLLMVGAVYLMTLVVDKLASMPDNGNTANAILGVVMIAAVIALMTAALGYASSLSNGGKGVLKIVTAVMMMTLAVGAMSLLFYLLSNLTPQMSEKVIWETIKIMAILAGLIIVMTLVTGYAASLGDGKGLGILIGVIAAMVVMAAVLILLTNFSWDQIRPALGAIAGCLGALGVAMFLIGLGVKAATTYKGGAWALIGATLMLGVLAASLALLANYSWESLAAGAIAMTAVLFVLAVSMAIIGDIKPDLGMLGTVLLAVVVLGAVFAGLYFLIPQIEALAGLDTMSLLANMAILVIAVGLLTAAVVGLAALGGKSPLMLGAMALISLVLLSIAVVVAVFVAAMSTLQSIDYMAIATGFLQLVTPMTALGNVSIGLIFAAVGVIVMALALVLLGLAGSVSANGITTFHVVLISLLNTLSAVGSAFQNANGSILGGLANLRDELDKSAEATAQTSEKLWSALAGGKNQNGIDTSAITEGISEVIPDVASNVTENAPQLGEAFAGAVSDAGETASEEATTQGESVGNAFFDSIKDGISGGVVDKNPLADIFEGGGFELSGENLLGDIDFSSIGTTGGEDFIKSFTGGISGNAETTSQAGNDVGEAVVDAANQTIESKSEETSNSILTMFSKAADTLDFSKIGDVVSGNFMNSLGESFLSESGVDSETLSGNFMPLIQGMVDNTDLSGTGNQMGTTIAESMANSLESNTNKLEVSNAATSLGNEANSGAKNVNTYSSGSYWGEGFVNGMWSWADRVWQTAYEIGKKAVDGVKAGGQEGSPWKTTIQSGKFLDQGLIVGIDLLGAKVQASGYRMGLRAVQAVEDGIQNGNPDGIVPVLDMSDICDSIDDFDATYRPVIKPTLDMSGMDPAFMNMQAVVSHKSSGANPVDAGASETVSPTSFNFTQNNYSPKALSRVAIYRQTKNQFSAVKDMIKK